MQLTCLVDYLIDYCELGWLSLQISVALLSLESLLLGLFGCSGNVVNRFDKRFHSREYICVFLPQKLPESFRNPRVLLL